MTSPLWFSVSLSTGGAAVGDVEWDSSQEAPEPAPRPHGRGRAVAEGPTAASPPPSSFSRPSARRNFPECVQ